MAVPSNIILTPNSSLDTNLPTLVNVQGTDIFERPNSTGSEDFSVVDSDWKGGALQGSGFIGDSFIGNGVDAYIQKTIPLQADSVRMCYASFFKLNTLGSIQYLFQALNSSDNDKRFAVGFRDDDRMFAYFEDGAGNEIAFRTDPNVITDNNWHHFFVWYNEPTKTYAIYLDGVEQTTSIWFDNGTRTSLSGIDTIEHGALISGLTPLDGEICNAYWSLTANAMQNDVLKYSNIPTTLLDLNDVSPSRYISETEYEVTAPVMSVGVKDFDITNSSGTGSTTFEVNQGVSTRRIIIS